jgi:hypothetical protein
VTPSILASAVSLPSLAGGSVPLVTSLRPDEPLTSIAHAVSGARLSGLYTTPAATDIYGRLCPDLCTQVAGSASRQERFLCRAI